VKRERQAGGGREPVGMGGDKKKKTRSRGKKIEGALTKWEEGRGFRFRRKILSDGLKKKWRDGKTKKKKGGFGSGEEKKTRRVSGGKLKQRE